MRTCRSLALLFAVVGMFLFTPFVLGATAATASTGTRPLPVQHAIASRLPAVQLSYNGLHAAWIVSQHGKTALVLASGSASNPRVVEIPGDCHAEGIRWARRWNQLAVLSRCTAGPGNIEPIREAIWVLDVHAGTPLRKVANVDGAARGLQWTSDGKQIAFLYRPDAPLGQQASRSSGPREGARSAVVAVPAAGGSLQVLTPSALYVHEFYLSRAGHGIAYTATSAVAGDYLSAPSLYSQRATPHAMPSLLFDPGNAQGDLHNLQITLPRSLGYGQIFFLGRSASAHGATGGDIYRVVANRGTAQNLTKQERLRPLWFTFRRGRLLVTQVTNGETQVAIYGLMGTWAKQVGLLFSVPGVLGDGQAPSAVSTSYYPGQRPRIAYFQRATAHELPILHVGVIGTQPAPAVTSALATSAFRAPAN